VKLLTIVLENEGIGLQRKVHLNYSYREHSCKLT